MAVSSPLSSRQTVAALLTLTAVSGLVDAVSYLRLGRVFVANMTGNVVFLGFTADPRSGLSAAASIIAIAGFILGALAGVLTGTSVLPSPGTTGSPPSPCSPRPSACRTAPSAISAPPT
jgi:Protein of unknown function (DUF1275)